jgi:hypothetical protein
MALQQVDRQNEVVEARSLLLSERPTYRFFRLSASCSLIFQALIVAPRSSKREPFLTTTSRRAPSESVIRCMPKRLVPDACAARSAQWFRISLQPQRKQPGPP